MNWETLQSEFYSDPIGFVLIATVGVLALLFLLNLLRRPTTPNDGAPGPANMVTPVPPPPVAAPSASHFRQLVDNGVSWWNKHRDERIDLSGVDFPSGASEPKSRIYGKPVDLRDQQERVVLRGIDLRGADLRGCILDRADMRDAVLADADLSGTSLKGAILEKANLSNANLIDANLEQAVLVRANLTRANLRGAHIEGANFAWANLAGAIGDRDELESVANMFGARLTLASFSGQRPRWLIFGRNLLGRHPYVTKARSGAPRK